MIYICDYAVPRSSDVESFVVEADDLESAEQKVIQELKTLDIPKRYIINISEVL